MSYEDEVDNTELSMEDHRRARELYDEKVREHEDVAQAAAYAAAELFRAKDDIEQSYEEFAATVTDYLQRDREELDDMTVEVMDSIQYVSTQMDQVENRDGVPQSVDDSIDRMQDNIDNWFN
jgi:prefoldin subunit 5